MTYPLDFRRKVFETKKRKGWTFEETSQNFSIPIRTLFRWQECLEPCLKRNKAATKIDMQALSEDIAASPDAYQWERAKRFGVSPSGIRWALKRLKITYKKNAQSSKSERKGTYQLPREDKGV